MPLIPAVLQAGFVRQLATASVANPALAASSFAATYFSYAVTAASFYGPFVPTGTEVLRLQETLRIALAVPIGAPNMAAQAWATGLQLFWLGAIFGAGAATTLPGVPAIAGQLTRVLSNPLNTAQTAAIQMATILDIGTRTLIIGGPSGPMPVL